MKILIARYQKKGESTIEYFHDKARMCRELNLEFSESKQQIIEGIFSRDLCMYLLSRIHSDENELLSDIVTFLKLNESRSARFKNDGQPFQTRSAISSPQLETAPRSHFPNKVKSRCYNCGSFDHISPSCTKPIRQQGSCFKCGSAEHKIISCPQSSGSRRHDNNSSNTAMVLQQNTMTTPAYTIRVNIKISDKLIFDILAIIDTGSPVSLLKNKIFPSDPVPSIEPCNSGIVGINGSELVILNQLYADIFMVDNDNPIHVKFNIVPDNTIQCDCLLGRNFLSNPRVIINIIDSKFEIAIKRDDIIPFNEILNLDIHSMPTNEIDLNIDSTIPDYIIDSLYNIYNNFYLSSTLDQKHCQTDSDPLEIVLKIHDVFYFQPWRLSYFEKKKMQEILDPLLEKGIIRPSKSEYGSPIVLVKKKSGDLRLCVDYRELNKRSVRDRYPIPLIDDHLDSLRNKKYFSSIDLKDGFHHIEVAESSRKHTSFTSPLGQYEYCKMPFGLCNGPSKFQRYINNIIAEFIKTEKVIVYFDDIVVATETLENQLDILIQVFKLMRKNNLQIRLDKCQFLKTEIIYLGYQVNATGIRPNPKNVIVIKNYPIPSNARVLKSFIGLASYFRRFIPNFALIAKPLYYLLKNDVKFNFGEDQIGAFEMIKSKLCENPLLALYNPIAETELHCDASSHGFGSILLQKQADGKFFYSHRTTDTESRYHSYELEMLAIINSVKRFRIYLQGIKFKIVTYCNSVAMTLAKKDINPRIARWALFLQDYDYKIEHRSGTQMQHVNALSRNHILVLEGCTFNQTLSIKQSSDPEIRDIIKLLENSEHKLYELRNGLVYRKSKKRLLFYVPTDMNILREFIGFRICLNLLSST